MTKQDQSRCCSANSATNLWQDNLTRIFMHPCKNMMIIPEIVAPREWYHVSNSNRSNICSDRYCTTMRWPTCTQGVADVCHATLKIADLLGSKLCCPQHAHEAAMTCCRAHLTLSVKAIACNSSKQVDLQEWSWTLDSSKTPAACRQCSFGVLQQHSIMYPAMAK